MKKWFGTLMVMMVLACLATGCGDGHKEGNDTFGQEDTINVEMGGATVVNPIRQVTYEELIDATGIPLYIPAEAGDVVYTTIAVEPTVAQAKFTLNDCEVCLRAVVTNETTAQDISGLYYQWETIDTVEIGYCSGAVYLKGDIGYVVWLDVVPGINYNLSLTSGATKEKLAELANAVFKEVQGDVE